jgi:transmembrane serine protease 2
MWRELFVLALAVAAALAVPQGTCGIVKADQDQEDDGNGNSCILSREGRIVGGCRAKNHAWPWMTSLRRSSVFGNYHTCGAELISSKWVLTAAHCIDGNMNPTAYRVDFGRVHRDTNEVTVVSRSLSRVLKHPLYNSPIRFSHDGALLELATPVDFNNEISPVCLPQVDVVGDESTRITGWGNVQNTCCTNWLKQAEVPIISQATCRQPGIYGSQIGDSMVCAGVLEGGTDTCQGDSGGPLVYKHTLSNGNKVWQVNGVTSWGYGCAQRNKPGVYGRVSTFLPWIKQVTDLEPNAF